MAFPVLFYKAINSRGLYLEDFESLLRIEDILTDEQLFTVSNFINESKASNIFFKRNVGTVSISLRMFDIALIYDFRTEDNILLGSLEIDFYKKTLVVYYENSLLKLEVYNDLLQYSNEYKNPINDLRMKFMSELLVRYLAKLVYAIYKDIERKPNQ